MRRITACALIGSAFLGFFLALAPAAEAPKPRSRSEVLAVLAKAPPPSAENTLRKLNIVLVADKKDHGENEHDYPLWQKRWSVLLGGAAANKTNQKQVNLYGPSPAGSRQSIFEGAPKVNVSTANGWPTVEQLKQADLVAMFCYGKWDERRLTALKQYLSRGGGFVAIHPAVAVPKNSDKELVLKTAELLGLAWEYDYSRWRHGAMDLKITAPNHPICLGLPQTIHFVDEAYWRLRQADGGVVALATSDEMVKPDSDATKPEPMFWTYEYGKGRVFGCIPGHYNWTFDDPYFRILVLRGMAWAAGESSYRFDSLVLRGVPLSD